MREFIKENKIEDKIEEEKELDLMLNIIKVKKELDNANKNFEFAEGDLIDYYTYQMKANRAKFDYLVKKAKQKGMAIDMLDKIDIEYNKAI